MRRRLVRTGCAVVVIGTYTPVLWASDGSARSRVRIELDVKSSCGY